MPKDKPTPSALTPDDKPYPVVILSAGHTYRDPGATHDALHEHDIATQICWYAAGILSEIERVGPPLMIVPPLDLFAKITAVNEMSKALGDIPHFALEVHVNAGGGTGVEAYHYPRNILMKDAAKMILKEFEGPRFPNRGAKTDKKSARGLLGWIRRTACDALLLEIGFIDSARDRKQFLESPEARYRAAIRLATGIERAATLVNARRYGEATSANTPKDWREGRV